MRRKSVSDISIREINKFGSHSFMSLVTAKILHSYRWDKLPIEGNIDPY